MDLLNASDKVVNEYNKEHPNMLTFEEIGFKLRAIIKVLEKNENLTNNEIATMLESEYTIERLFNLVFRKTGANKTYIKYLKGE
jgi:hypothetical protein